jgi:streptogramin lyase
MKTKSLFSFVILLLIISACSQVTSVTTIAPTLEPTATIQPVPQPVEPWPGMEPGWTVFWRTPYLGYPIYDPAGHLWVLNTRGAYRWKIENGEMDLFTQADGLPAGILSLASFDGKIWASTQSGGVASFDGVKWTVEKLSEKSLNGFSETPGRLWVYSDEEKRTFFYENGAWSEFKETPEDLPSFPKDSPPLRAVAQSKDGALWFHYWNGTWSFDGETWEEHNNLSKAEKIFSAPDGTVFFVFDNIVILYDGQNFTPVIFPGGFYTYNMNYQFQTPDGELWVSQYDYENNTENAYLVHSDVSVENVPYKPVPPPEKPEDSPFWGQGLTPDGLLLSNGQALGLYQDGQLKIYTVADEEFNKLIGTYVFIGFTPDGALWSRKSNGNLARYDGSNIEYPFQDYLKSHSPGYNIKINSMGELWAADGIGLIKFKMGEEPVEYKVNMQISDFYFAPDGSIWVEDYDGFIARIDPQDLAVKTVLNADYIQIGEGVVGKNLAASRIKTAPNGDLWVYVDEAGFFRFDGASWKFFRLGEAGIDASNFAINSRGEIWVGTTNHLSKYDRQEWIKYERNCICPSDLTIAPDDTVWFITGCDGIMHFDGNEWTHYPREKELSGVSPYDIVVAPDGAMWFISSEAWVRYQP